MRQNKGIIHKYSRKKKWCNYEISSYLLILKVFEWFHHFNLIKYVSFLKLLLRDTESYQVSLVFPLIKCQFSGCRGNQSFYAVAREIFKWRSGFSNLMYILVNIILKRRPCVIINGKEKKKCFKKIHELKLSNFRVAVAQWESVELRASFLVIPLS